MKAVVAAFNQEKALVGAFSVITNLRIELFEALVHSVFCVTCGAVCAVLTAGPPRIWKVMMMDSPEQNTKSATEFFTQRFYISSFYLHVE